jgi:hypothetical protein
LNLTRLWNPDSLARKRQCDDKEEKVISHHD